MEARQAGEARQQVTALYRAHAFGLVKLAVLMVGDQLTAEDVVQDAFLGLYRRWAALQDQDKALSYVRASVVNECRMIHRVKYRRDRVFREDPGQAESAEATAMLGEAHREVLAALRRLPGRQREAVVRRYHRDMTEDQAAGYEWLATHDEDWRRALDVQASLGRGGRMRAVGLPDLLIAALAEREQVIVLHYDGDYELIAQVTGQPVQWVVPRRTVP
jgi:RNA polymerase sigma factor (sigma-70 family)